MNPTKEQIQWFWEQCGFKLDDDGDFRWWYLPDGSHLSLDEDPLLDINNLFKYAVPKLIEKIGRYDLVTLVINAFCDALEAGGEFKDYLFWAIYKALGG